MILTIDVGVGEGEGGGVAQNVMQETRPRVVPS
jgi:hypothetical protein